MINNSKKPLISEQLVSVFAVVTASFSLNNQEMQETTAEESVWIMQFIGSRSPFHVTGGGRGQGGGGGGTRRHAHKTFIQHFVLFRSSHTP